MVNIEKDIFYYVTVAQVTQRVTGSTFRVYRYIDYCISIY